MAGEHPGDGLLLQLVDWHQGFLNAAMDGTCEQLLHRVGPGDMAASHSMTYGKVPGVVPPPAASLILTLWADYTSG